MTHKISFIVAWGCFLILLLLPVAALYFLFNLESLLELARNSIHLPIQWATVSQGQAIALWGAVVLYLTIGWFGLLYLRRAFSAFAKGELFNPENSLALRRAAALMFTQALLNPVQAALNGVILSWNHPAGQKILSITIGSGAFKVIFLALILWVLSDLLVKARALDVENRQFV